MAVHPAAGKHGLMSLQRVSLACVSLACKFSVSGSSACGSSSRESSACVSLQSPFLSYWSAHSVRMEIIQVECLKRIWMILMESNCQQFSSCGNRDFQSGSFPFKPESDSFSFDFHRENSRACYWKLLTRTRVWMLSGIKVLVKVLVKRFRRELPRPNRPYHFVCGSHRLAIQASCKFVSSIVCRLYHLTGTLWMVPSDLYSLNSILWLVPSD